VGLVPAVSLLCYGSTESDPVAYVVSPFKRRDGTIPLRPIRSPFERMTWLIVYSFSTRHKDVRRKCLRQLCVLYEPSAASSRPDASKLTVSFVSHISLTI